jgi:peptidyl-prolyl cis-trans isomerase C
MKSTVYRGLFFVLLGSMAACQKSQGPVVARVGGSPITLSDLKSRLEDAPPAYQQYAQTPQGRKEFLNILIREKILEVDAKNAGISREASYRQAVQQFKDQQVQRLKDYENTLLIESYLRKLRSKELAASDADVQAYYDQNQADYAHPMEISVSHILVESPADAEKVLARLKAGEPFEKVAQEVSKDPMSAARGGKLQPFRKGSLVKPFEDAAFALKVGQLSGPVQTQFGYHIIKKTGEKALPEQKFSDVKEAIRQRLERTKFDQWVAQKQGTMGVKIQEDALAQLSLPAAPPPADRGAISK